MTKKVIIKTRPFQQLLQGADDLLGLAKPYYDKIEQNRRLNEGRKELKLLEQDVWQTEKSLSIGSFMMKYAGLEALANCTYTDFQLRKLESLPDKYLVRMPKKARKELTNKAFAYWPLRNRVFLLVPLCSDPVVDPNRVFDTESSEWSRFEETVQIRNSFAHPASIEVKSTWTRKEPKIYIDNDDYPSNFWPRTKTPKNHRILNYEIALTLNGVIDWVVGRLRQALPAKLNEDYMTKEEGTELDKRGKPIATFALGRFNHPSSD